MSKTLFLSPPRRHDGSQYLFNNATLSLASFLKKRGQDCYVAPLAGPEWESSLEKALREHKPDWVAVSCKWWDTLYGAVEVARRVKKLRPECRLVTGGQTATSFARQLIEHTPFDAVVQGDGELPLFDLVRGQPSCNLVLRDGEQVRQFDHKYVQPRGGTDDLTLVEDLASIADLDLLHHAGLDAPFVWTGKGCQSACLFCAGSAWGHKKLFGRTGYMYRPLEQTVADMEALAPWSRNAFLFDFDPVTDPAKGDYYMELSKQLPKGKYHAAFYCWSIPSEEFIEMVSQTFASALISLDAQTYSEPLRRRLASQNRIKPFSSDLEILRALEAIRKRPNLHGVVYGIIGLAGEQPADVERADSFMNYLQDAYADVLQANGVNLTPLTIEPESLMDRNPEKYGVVKLRRSFQDYLEFTGSCFARSGGDIFHAPYDPALPHPYGVHLEGDHPGRVHADYWRLQGRVKEKSEQFEARKAIEAFGWDGPAARLRLEARTVYQDDWRLLIWAAGETLRAGRATLRVDARAAPVKVPPMQLLPFGEQFRWLKDQLPPIQEAVRAGRLRIHIESRPGSHWGFLEELGARIVPGS